MEWRSTGIPSASSLIRANSVIRSSYRVSTVTRLIGRHLTFSQLDPIARALHERITAARRRRARTPLVGVGDSYAIELARRRGGVVRDAVRRHRSEVAHAGKAHAALVQVRRLDDAPQRRVTAVARAINADARRVRNLLRDEVHN